jgi:hypothetical protein
MEKEREVSTFIIFSSRLVDDGAVLKTAKVEHSNTAISTTTYKNINTIGAEADIEDLLVVCNELSFGS